MPQPPKTLIQIKKKRKINFPPFITLQTIVDFLMFICLLGLVWSFVWLYLLEML